MNKIETYLNPLSATKINYRAEILAGLTVAMTMMPESLSFAIVTGFTPLMGLYAAFLMGLITALFGGRPGMISGGAGATAIVFTSLVISHGVEYVLGAVAVAGIIQILLGVFKWGKFIRLVPESVMYGFVNGLAVVIFTAQFSQFKIKDSLGNEAWMLGNDLYLMLALVALTIAVIYIFPKITKIIPASLAAIIVVTLLTVALDIETKTVADIASVSGSLPQFHIPNIPMTWESLAIVLQYGIVMAGVGLTESLLTLTLVDQICENRGSSNKEAIAQGAANVANGFLGGMGGCAMIAQSFINLEAGARSRLSGIVGALAILIVILFAAPIIEKIPMAALVGVMFIVAINTFKWSSFKIINKVPSTDLIVVVVVASITIFFHNLALAVLTGVIIASLVFAWESAKRIRARKSIDEEGRKVYEIFGPLFFASTMPFMEKFDVINDPEIVIIDFAESRIADMSAIDTISKLTELYKKYNKTIILRHLSEDSRLLLANAASIIEVNIEEDPTYRIPI